MDAGSIKSKGFLTTAPLDRAVNSRGANSQNAKDALLTVQAELGVALRTAKILAQEGPPISPDEATETAERVVELLKASHEAFGGEAILFQDLSPHRAKALLT